MKTQSNDSDEKKIIVGAFYNIVAMVFDKANTIIVTLIISRLYGEEAVGIYSYYFASALLLSSVVTTGISNAIVGFAGKYYQNEKELLGRMLGALFLLSVLICVVIAILVASLGKNAFYISNHEISLGLFTSMMLLAMFLQALDLNMVNLIRGLEEHKSLIGISIKRSFIALPITVALISVLEVKGAVISLVLFYLVWLAFLGQRVNQLLKQHNISVINNLKLNKSIVVSVFCLAGPFTIASLVAAGSSWVQRYLIATSPGAFSDLGVFSIIFQLSILFTYVTGSIGSSLVPVLARYADDSKRWGEAFSLASTKVFVVLSIILLGLTLNSGLILSVFRAELVQHVDLCKALFISLYVNALVWLLGPALLSRIESKLYLGLTLLKHAIMLPAIYYWLSDYGLFIIPFMYVITDLIVYMLFLFLHRNVRFFVCTPYELIVSAILVLLISITWDNLNVVLNLFVSIVGAVLVCLVTYASLDDDVKLRVTVRIKKTIGLGDY